MFKSIWPFSLVKIAVWVKPPCSFNLTWSYSGVFDGDWPCSCAALCH
jgi:hypothetical protein